MAWLILVGLVSLTGGDPDPAGTSLDEVLAITLFVKGLSADRFEEREQAFFYLQFFGKKALPFLEAARKTADFQTQLKMDYLIHHVPLLQEMVPIPGGMVTLGDDNPYVQNPKRQVELKSYRIDKYEVTNFMYYVFVMQEGHPPPKTWINQRFGLGREDFPVTEVSFDDAQAYARWMNKRIPFEEEWEYAARGKEGNLYPWGNNEYRGAANIDNLKTFAKTRVGTFNADQSSWGCMDLAGNVSEWVLTRSKEGKELAACKGSAFNKAWRRPFTLSSFRATRKDPDKKARDIGFRCTQ